MAFPLDPTQNPIDIIATQVFDGNLPKALREALLCNDYDNARKELLEFLTKVGENPRYYGIIGENHDDGVKRLCQEFIKSKKNKKGELIKEAKLYSEEGCEVKFHDRNVQIHDCDAALGYIMSVQKSKPPIPSDLRCRRFHSEKIYVPLVALFCFLMKVLRPQHGNMPSVACILVRDNKIAIGANIRSEKLPDTPKDRPQAKGLIHGKRKPQLTKLFPAAKLQQKRELETEDVKRLKDLVHEVCQQDFGHCAETYPFLAFLENNDHPSFTGSVHGFAVNAKDIAAEEIKDLKLKKKYAYADPYQYPRYQSPGGWYWKRPCFNCRTVLGWGYDCS